MKKFMVYLSFQVICSISFLSGCAPYENVSETIYMQDAKIDAPLFQIPIFLSTSDTSSIMEVIPRIFLGRNKSALIKAGSSTRVNRDGIFQVDTIFENGYYYYRPAEGVNVYSPKKYNCLINSTIYSLGLDANLSFSKLIVISGGFSYSQVNYHGLMGYRAGIGFKNYEAPYGIRFDAGLFWQETYYDVSTIVVTTTKEWFGGTTTSAGFFRDEGTHNNSGYYLNMDITFNDEYFPLGGFLNFGFHKQTLLDVEPSNYDKNYYYDDTLIPIFGTYSRQDMRQSVDASFFNFTPGLMFEYFPSARIIGGARFIFEIGDQKSVGKLISPFLQMQFAF